MSGEPFTSASETAAQGTPVGNSSIVDSHTPTVPDKFYAEEPKGGDGFEPEFQPTIEKKPASAYLTVSLLCVLVSFGGFLPGWDTGIMAGFVNMDDFKQRFGSYNHKTETYYLSNVRTGLLVAIFSAGCAFGGLTLPKLGDIYGRRLGLMIVIVLYVVGTIIQISAQDKWYQYFIGKIIYGWGVGGVSVLAPMLISETAPKHLRGTLISCYQLMVTFGIFLGYCAVYGTRKYNSSAQWRIPVGLCFLWAMIIIGGMTFVPESPRFLVEVGRMEEAKRSVARSNKVDPEEVGVQIEIDLIAAGVEAERQQGKASWGELFSTKTKVLQRLITGILMQSFLQLTGENYFFYYGTTIFKSIGLTDSFETSIVLGIVNFASTFLSMYVVDAFGRRKCLLWGAAGMTACMVVFASVGVTSLWPNGENVGEASKGAGNCMIVFTCFFIFCFATTWAPIAYVVVAESFPLRVKSKCMSISTAFNWLWQFLIGFFTPFITSAIKFYYGYVFMGCLVAMFLYVFFFLPETSGLTLEEVQILYDEGIPPWRSADWVPPSRRFDGPSPVDLEAGAKKPWYKF